MSEKSNVYCHHYEFKVYTSKTGCSVNMIQHKRHLLNHCYIYISKYAHGVYAAVDFSYDMTYSRTGTMLHLAELA